LVLGNSLATAASVCSTQLTSRITMYVMYHEMTMLDSLTPRIFMSSRDRVSRSDISPTKILDSGCKYARMKKMGKASATAS